MMELLDTLGSGATFIGVALLGLVLISLQREAVVPIGMAANRRREACKKSMLFRLCVPMMQALSVPVSWLPLKRQRDSIRVKLIYAGQPGGVTPDELMALGVMVAVALPVIFGLISFKVLGHVHPAVFIAAPIGLRLPVSRVTDRVTKRVEAIERRLPYALDLIIVCAEAGSGLEDAVGRMVDASGVIDPLTEEFAHFRQEAEMMGLRRSLRALADRVPSMELRRLVESIMEGEDQGTPYRQILITSRDMIRTRQSARIEKQASRAAQLIIIPTMMIFCAVALMLVGGMLLRACQDAPV